MKIQSPWGNTANNWMDLVYRSMVWPWNKDIKKFFLETKKKILAFLE